MGTVLTKRASRESLFTNKDHCENVNSIQSRPKSALTIQDGCMRTAKTETISEDNNNSSDSDEDSQDEEVDDYPVSPYSASDCSRSYNGRVSPIGYKNYQQSSGRTIGNSTSAIKNNNNGTNNKIHTVITIDDSDAETVNYEADSFISSRISDFSEEDSLQNCHIDFTDHGGKNDGNLKQLSNEQIMKQVAEDVKRQKLSVFLGNQSCSGSTTSTKLSSMYSRPDTPALNPYDYDLFYDSDATTLNTIISKDNSCATSSTHAANTDVMPENLLSGQKIDTVFETTKSTCCGGGGIISCNNISLTTAVGDRLRRHENSKLSTVGLTNTKQGALKSTKGAKITEVKATKEQAKLTRKTVRASRVTKPKLNILVKSNSTSSAKAAHAKKSVVRQEVGPNPLITDMGVASTSRFGCARKSAVAPWRKNNQINIGEQQLIVQSRKVTSKQMDGKKAKANNIRNKSTLSNNSSGETSTSIVLLAKSSARKATEDNITTPTLTSMAKEAVSAQKAAFEKQVSRKSSLSQAYTGDTAQSVDITTTLEMSGNNKKRASETKSATKAKKASIYQESSSAQQQQPQQQWRQVETDQSLLGYQYRHSRRSTPLRMAARAAAMSIANSYRPIQVIE